MKKLIFPLFLIVLFGCNNNPVPPEGMVLIKGGKATIGANEGPANEQPEMHPRINSFYMDISPVTVAEFRKFIEATNYRT